MDSHKGIRALGKLYGFLSDLAIEAEDGAVADGVCAVTAEEDDSIADEDCAVFAMAESAALDVGFVAASPVEEDCAAISVEELLTAGVICCVLDEDSLTHIDTSEELDSGTYRSIW